MIEYKKYAVWVDGKCVGQYDDPKEAADFALSQWSAFGPNRDEHDVDITDPFGHSAWNLCMEAWEPEPQ